MNKILRLKKKIVFTLEQPRKRRHGGPKRDQVWEYVNIGDSLGDGQYKADCKYCRYE